MHFVASGLGKNRTVIRFTDMAQIHDDNENTLVSNALFAHRTRVQRNVK